MRQKSGGREGRGRLNAAGKGGAERRSGPPAYRKLFHYNGVRHIFYSIIRLRSILVIGFLTGQQVARIHPASK